MGNGVAGLLVFALLILLIYSFRNERRPYKTQVMTIAGPDIVVRHAIRTYTAQGWQSTTHNEGNVSFVKELRRGFMGSRRRVLTINVSTQSLSPQASVVDFVTNMNGAAGRKLANSFLHGLPPAAADATVTGTTPQSGSGDAK